MIPSFRYNILGLENKYEAFDRLKTAHEREGRIGPKKEGELGKEVDVVNVSGDTTLDSLPY